MNSTLACLVIFVACGCYFGWRTFMALAQDGEVNRLEFALALVCYGCAIAASARMGGYFAL
jgi:hypothetical protein